MIKIKKGECKVVDGDIVCNKKMKNGKYERVKIDIQSLVKTNKRKSYTYIILYIIGLFLFLASAIVNMINENYIWTANYVFIAGIASTILATIIWGFDRTKSFRK